MLMISMLTQEQISQFHKNGYLVLPQFSDSAFCQSVLNLAQASLDQELQPMEYEADTRYPGAPISRDAQGGKTARRLLQAYGRSTLLSGWASQAKLVTCIGQLLNQKNQKNQESQEIFLSQAHHNCIMTKQAQFSSLTGWHRDSRYWQFQRAELVTAWLALRDETVENGCLLVMPGSHLWSVEASQLDEAQFLRAELPQNQSYIAQAKAVELKQGDVLLFSSNLFHAAGCNQTQNTKFSMVFTYRAKDNPPRENSRSASYPEIALS